MCCSESLHLPAKAKPSSGLLLSPALHSFQSNLPSSFHLLSDLQEQILMAAHVLQRMCNKFSPESVKMHGSIFDMPAAASSHEQPLCANNMNEKHALGLCPKTVK